MDNTHASPFESSTVPDGYRRHLEPVIFAPWARRLISLVRLVPGQAVLDVASGTGVVARAAASAVGADGRVIASDISMAMLAQVQIGADPGGAPIETLVCSATELKLPPACVDVVLCQQGFPFIPDRLAAAREMRRVLRAGGKIGVAVWLAGRRLEPFDTYSDVLRVEGVEPPFPNAYDSTQYEMSPDDVRQILVVAGFGNVRVTTEDLELHWASPEAAVVAIAGTPFGPALTVLDVGRQHRIMTALRQAMNGADAGPPHHVMTAVLACGTTV